MIMEIIMKLWNTGMRDVRFNNTSAPMLQMSVQEDSTEVDLYGNMENLTGK